MAALHEDMVEYDSIIPMDEQEAEAATRRIIEHLETIGDSAESIGVLFKEMEARFGWRTLGYPSMAGYVKERLHMSVATLQRRITANRIDSLIVKHNQVDCASRLDYPQDVKLSLTPLADQPDAINAVLEEIREEGGKVTAGRVRSKVQQLRPPKPLSRWEEAKHEHTQRVREERDKHTNDPYYIQEQVMAGVRALMSKAVQQDAALVAESLDEQSYAFVSSSLGILRSWWVDVEAARAMQQEAE